MDELLYGRIKQLKEIDDRLERMDRMTPDSLRRAVKDLRFDLALMIQRAEQDHADF